MVFLFYRRFVESKFTLFTYLTENNTVITVISYCTKGLKNSKTKQKPIPTIHDKTLFTVMRFSTTDMIIIILQESSMNSNVRTDVRMQRGFRVKRCRTNRERPTKMQNYALL